MTRDVVFATDLSGSSAPAGRVAADHARLANARLHLLHVVWPTGDPVPEPALDALARELGAGVPVITAVESGMPVADVIIRYAQRHRIGLIVLGTHGRTGVSRALIGSVAERVVRTARCPVLTVPAAWREPGAGDEASMPDISHCLVCRAVSPDLICAACRARIRGEALERKQRDERAGR